jgi:hypothetical protein
MLQVDFRSFSAIQANIIDMIVFIQWKYGVAGAASLHDGKTTHSIEDRSVFQGRALRCHQFKFGPLLHRLMGGLIHNPREFYIQHRL